MSVCCNHDHGHTDKPAMRKVLWAALVINASMFAVEIYTGWLSGSVGLQADAVDFFGDAASYLISLIVLGMAVTWQTRAAFLKGLTMGLFGLWVAGNIAYHWIVGTVPSAPIMGGVGILALVANVACAVMLFKFRDADANMASVWVCSRNDALSNIAIVLAALGVWGTGSGIPDLLVAVLIGGLALYGALEILRRAMSEHDETHISTAEGFGD